MKIFFLVFLLASLSAQASVLQGNEGVGGGDESGLEFQQRIASAVKYIAGADFPLPPGVSADTILTEAANAKVIFVENALQVFANGIEQDSIAANHPSIKIIEVNRARWNLVRDTHMQEAIALHEVLSLLGAESTGVYPFSSKYAALFGFAANNFGVAWQNLIHGAEGVTVLTSESCSMVSEIENRDGTFSSYTQDDLGITASWKVTGVLYKLNNNLSVPKPAYDRLVIAQSRIADLGATTSLHQRNLMQTVKGGLRLVVRDGAFPHGTNSVENTNSPDGSLVSVWKTESRDSTFGGTVRATSSCTIKPLSYGWVAAWGDPAFGARVKEFSTSILVAATAEAAWKDCTAVTGGPACDLQRQSLDRAIAAADFSWENLIRVDTNGKIKLTDLRSSAQIRKEAQELKREIKRQQKAWH